MNSHPVTSQVSPGTVSRMNGIDHQVAAGHMPMSRLCLFHRRKLHLFKKFLMKKISVLEKDSSNVLSCI